MSSGACNIQEENGQGKMELKIHPKQPTRCTQFSAEDMDPKSKNILY